MELPEKDYNEIDALARARERREGGLLRCVSSGYLSDGCSCRTTIPAAVVKSALGAELTRDGSPGGRFFHFGWRGQAWLAFGLATGEIRGVYCPAHRAEREFRAADAGSPEPLQPAAISA